jgi:signal transduction histidine kinase
VLGAQDRQRVGQTAQAPPVQGQADVARGHEQQDAVGCRAEQTCEEATVSTTDRGTGIAPGDLPHIFERVYIVPGARKSESVGLGLYVTQMPAEALGGRIWAESELGRGSTFHFCLPFA